MYLTVFFSGDRYYMRDYNFIENISITTKEMIAKKLVEKISNELRANG